MNEITSYVDGSNVYGSSQEELDMLRKNGELANGFGNITETIKS